MSCKFLGDVERDSDVLILSGKLFHCFLGQVVQSLIKVILDLWKFYLLLFIYR